MKKIALILFLVILVAACSHKTPTEDVPAKSDENKSAKPTAIKPESGDKVFSDIEYNQETASREGDWSEAYEGTIDGKIQVKLDLHGRERMVSGTITYKNSGMPIMVLGHFGDEMELREFQADGLISGTMTGRPEAGKYVGTWSSGAKEYKLDLNSTGAGVSHVKWPYTVKGPISGEYAYHYPTVNGEPGAAGKLTIKTKDLAYAFSMQCSSGPPAYRKALVHETEVDLEGNGFRYRMPEGDCQFEVRVYRGFAIAKHFGEHYGCGFGPGAGEVYEFVKLP